MKFSYWANWVLIFVGTLMIVRMGYVVFLSDRSTEFKTNEYTIEKINNQYSANAQSLINDLVAKISIVKMLSERLREEERVYFQGMADTISLHIHRVNHLGSKIINSIENFESDSNGNKTKEEEFYQLTEKWVLLIDQIPKIEGILYRDTLENLLFQLQLFGLDVNEGLEKKDFRPVVERFDRTTLLAHIQLFRKDFFSLMQQYLHMLIKHFEVESPTYPLCPPEYKIYPERFLPWIYKGQHQRTSLTLKGLIDPACNGSYLIQSDSLFAKGNPMTIDSNGVWFTDLAKSTGNHPSDLEIFFTAESRPNDSFSINGTVNYQVGEKSAKANLSWDPLFVVGKKQKLPLTPKCGYFVKPELHSLSDDLKVYQSQTGEFYVLPMREGKFELLLKDRRVFLDRITIRAVVPSLSLKLQVSEKAPGIRLVLYEPGKLIKAEYLESCSITDFEVHQLNNQAVVQKFSNSGEDINPALFDAIRLADSTDYFAVNRVNIQCEELLGDYSIQSYLFSTDDFRGIINNSDDGN